MNLADAIRKAALEGSASPTPPVLPPTRPIVSSESVPMDSPAVTVSPTLAPPVGPEMVAELADSVQPASPNVTGGNVVRLELFLSAEQMSGLFRAIMAGQHTVLTLREAAAHLRVPAAALEKLAQEGEVPGLLIDGRWRFPKSSLDEWLAWRALPPEENEHVA